MVPISSLVNTKGPQLPPKVPIMRAALVSRETPIPLSRREGKNSMAPEAEIRLEKSYVRSKLKPEEVKLQV